jgi:hypothetical protein
LESQTGLDSTDTVVAATVDFDLNVLGIDKYIDDLIIRSRRPSLRAIDLVFALELWRRLEG